MFNCFILIVQARDVITFWNTGTSHLLQARKFNHSSSHHCMVTHVWVVIYQTYLDLFIFTGVCSLVNCVKHLCSFGRRPVTMLLILVQCLQLWTNYVQTYGKTITLTTHSSRHYGHRVDGNRSDFNTLTIKFSHLFALFIFFPVFHYCGVLLIMLNTCVHLEDFLLLLLILVQCLQLCTWPLL